MVMLKYDQRIQDTLHGFCYALSLSPNDLNSTCHAFVGNGYVKKKRYQFKLANQTINAAAPVS